ncbi:MAG: VWA domain-containing protein [Victivallales bacterium]|nr:VWA domain-containing protein [Victivallales bacterium]
MTRALSIEHILLFLLILTAGLHCRATWRRWHVLRQLPNWRGGAALLLALACVIGALWCVTMAYVRTPPPPPRIACLLDCSASMAAKSGSLTRLAVGKQVLAQVARAFPQAELALVTFAASTLVDFPFSNDHGAFHEALASAGVDNVLLPGSSPALAIRQAESLGATAMVICTDGEATVPAAPGIWSSRHTPLALVTCGDSPAPIPNGDTFFQAPGTGQTAVSTPGSLLPEASLSSAPVIQLAPKDSSALRSFLLEALGSPAARGHWICLALLLLLGVLLAPQLPRLFHLRQASLPLILALCTFLALPCRSASPLPIPDSALPARLATMRNELRNATLAPQKRAFLLSNLSAILCRQAQLVPHAETIQEALAASREALRLQPGLPSACNNLALALRLESTLATVGTASPPNATGPPKKNNAAPPQPSSRSQPNIPPATPHQSGNPHETLTSQPTSFGSWRELQEKKAKRNLRASPTTRPW